MKKLKTSLLKRPEAHLSLCENYREIFLHDVKVNEADHQPGPQRQQRDGHDEGYEVPAEPVCKLLDGRLENTRKRQTVIKLENILYKLEKTEPFSCLKNSGVVGVKDVPHASPSRSGPPPPV